EFQHFSVIERYNGLNLEREELKGFEIDEIAPPMPRKSPKKKKTRLSKKQKLRQAEEQKKTGKEPEEKSVEDDKAEETEPAVNAHIWGNLKR
ncbi:MAG: hypothetical protein KAJ63_05520, partial [Methyloprofundus sp.]|nr:hypothetical protein [Methyloprofundus sp.]